MIRNIYFWGDLHLGHSNAYKFPSADGDRNMRSFSSMYACEKVMVDNYNSIVKDNDIVYFLGDVWLDKKRGPQILKYMKKGSKHLIMGNHDNKSDINTYIECFDKIYGVLYLPKIKCILSHVPIHPSFLGPQIHLEGKVRFDYNIAGHTHDYHIKKEHKKDMRYLNSCVEIVNYRPVTFEQLKEINLKYV